MQDVWYESNQSCNSALSYHLAPVAGVLDRQSFTLKFSKTDSVNWGITGMTEISPKNLIKVHMDLMKR